ncbi:MAG: glycoside hydrolase family 97 catalytic domain-containing protein [Chitinophagaceae bacterium]
MLKKITGLATFLLLSVTALCSQKEKTFILASPDGKVTIGISAGNELKWEVKHANDHVIIPSAISLQLQSGEILGKNMNLISSKKRTVNGTINAIAYKKKIIINNFNELVINFKGEYGVIFRAYNDGVAYRFIINRKEDMVIRSEQAEFNFDKDYTVLIPHVSDLRGKERYTCSFEEFYTETPVSKFNKDTLGYLPLLIKLNNDKKAVLIEADVQDYPGMFVQLNQRTAYGINATFAPYPLEEALGGHNKLNYMVTKRADHIAKVKGTRNFPWRAIVISEQDKELLDNDMVQKLSGPSKIEDPGWLRPGKVVWDWWNDWNISNVDFKAGINNTTYKYYIDFANTNKIEYIMLDEGWSDDWDLTKLKPEIDLKELIEYAKQRKVNILLWTTWYALSKDIEGLCKRYADIGIKGLKIDFLDRNDQKMIASCYEMAATAAKYHLMLDFHGMFPPQGLQRTWPNVINFEAVRGMEYMKWSADDRVPAYEVSFPFIRMMAGPLDYTPGAMRNTVRGKARPDNSSPMSLGTRCHQLAMYVVLDAPLQMLADNPTAYMKEQESTDLIARIPTVFDETIALDGKLAEYVVLAKKKDSTWYIGAMNNWNARAIILDLSFLSDGEYEAEIFSDGVNANKNATDYKREVKTVSAKDKLTIAMQSGGGWVARVRKIQSKAFELTDKKATKETVALFNNLLQLSKDHILFGHQHATEYGHGWSGEAGRSDVKSITGSHPGVIGVDFSGLSGRPDSAIARTKEALIKNITETYERGAVTTVAWHFSNPASRGGFNWVDTVSAPAVKLIIPGGSHHEKYKQILATIADVANSVKGRDGTLAPMIFRPYHEFDGDWFWWGRAHCSTDDFKTLWRFTVTYLRDSLNVHNFIYAFSPDCKFNTTSEYLERYPGNEYVDMAGVDNYADWGRDKYDLQTGIKKLKIVSDFAKRNGKLAAFTETGLESIPNTTWWTETLLKGLKTEGLQLTYVLVWRNDIRSPTHFYAPFPGQVSEQDFIKFYNDPFTIFEKDLKDIYK